jgi:hypothetical protein
MLTVLGLALLAVTAVVAGRWWLNRVDSLGRRTSFPSISVGLMVVLAAGSFSPGVLRAHLEGQLSAASSRLVGVHVKVHCQGLGGALADVGAELGYVKFGQDGTPERQTLIKRDQCRAISRYLHSDKRHPSEVEVQAVHVLSHESMHMAGVTVESAAECGAVQRDMRLAELLGASAADAQALADSYWTSQYPRMPDDYRSAECRAGGQLDEHLADPPWAG